MRASAPTTAERLASWAVRLNPGTEDEELAIRSLIDTAAVAVAARKSEITPFLHVLGPAGGLSALAHFLDYDDLHLPSTAHISAVCVPATAANEGSARAFLAGAGVMARIGTALGWSHYSRGWHATCTAGAPAAAMAVAVANGLSDEEMAHALALALPGGGGVQSVFGTHGKALQVGVAVDSGVRAAELASEGARTRLDSLDTWLELVGGHPDRVEVEGPAVPGGLAIKVFPCCYALQRPIQAARTLAEEGIMTDVISRIVVRTPRSTRRPLIYSRPTSGLQAKFSLEYGIAAALVDHPIIGFDTFSDQAIARPEVERLRSLVQVQSEENGTGLLDGTTEITLTFENGESRSVALSAPPGAPGAPLSHQALREKVETCSPGASEDLLGLTWEMAPSFLQSLLAEVACGP